MPVAPRDELNVYESAEARFEIAAQKLGLEEGVYRYLKYPKQGNHGVRPGGAR